MWQPMIQDEDQDFPLTCVLLCAGTQIQDQKKGGVGNDYLSHNLLIWVYYNVQNIK